MGTKLSDDLDMFGPESVWFGLASQTIKSSVKKCRADGAVQVRKSRLFKMYFGDTPFAACIRVNGEWFTVDIRYVSRKWLEVIRAVPGRPADFDLRPDYTIHG